MAKLSELAPGYREAAILLKIGIDDLKEEMKTADERRRNALSIDLKMMRTMLNEVRSVHDVCLTYYTAPRNGLYTMTRSRKGR